MARTKSAHGKPQRLDLAALYMISDLRNGGLGFRAAFNAIVGRVNDPGVVFEGIGTILTQADRTLFPRCASVVRNGSRNRHVR